MSLTAYFGPGIVGALVGLIYAIFGGDDYSYTTTDRVILGFELVPGLFLICQLLMIAAQGIFAAVLPVPFGKTLRGAKCVAIGVLMLVGMVCGAVAQMLGGVEIGLAAIVVGAASLLCAIVAVGLYVWSLPTAVVDFVD
ncbi:MAG: hypothetical protein GY842_19235 [bacterium]|nr:hypothetical protein [bacterium]